MSTNNSFISGQQTWTPEQLRLVEVGLNGANVVYNADKAGQLQPGTPLTAARDLEVSIGIDQPYAGSMPFCVERPCLISLMPG